MSQPTGALPPQNGSAEPPLSQPYYGAPIGAAVRRFFGKYADFSGRASRSEYWWWLLANVIIYAVLEIIANIGGGMGNASSGPSVIYIIINIILGIWGLATIVPWLALSWRRFHDTNHSGGFWFLGFIPIVGGIIVLIFMLLPPNPEGARFDR